MLSEYTDVNWSDPVLYDDLDSGAAFKKGHEIPAVWRSTHRVQSVMNGVKVVTVFVDDTYFDRYPLVFIEPKYCPITNQDVDGMYLMKDDTFVYCNHIFGADHKLIGPLGQDGYLNMETPTFVDSEAPISVKFNVTLEIDTNTKTIGLYFSYPMLPMLEKELLRLSKKYVSPWKLIERLFMVDEHVVRQVYTLKQ